MEDYTSNQLNEPFSRRIDVLESKIDRILEIVASEMFLKPPVPEKLILDKELLTIQDIEKDFGISPHRQRVARKCLYNQLEYIMVGNGIRYRKDQVNKWLDKQSITSE